MLAIDRKLVFLDVEATSLDILTARPWEIAMIERWPDGRERSTLLHVRDVDLTYADPEALRIGRFEERYRQEPGAFLADEHIAAGWLESRTSAEPRLGLPRPYLVGSAVGTYDATVLAALLARQGRAVPWYHHPIDLVTWTQARLAAQGAEVSLAEHGSYDLSRMVGVEPPAPAVAHTAMGDAVWARAWWDAMTGAVS